MNNNIDIFLAGEIHGVSENAEIKFAVFENLVKNYNVRKLLVEMGFYDSMALNIYISTGAEKVLSSVLTKNSLNYCNTEDEFEFWRKVCNLNMYLEENERIEVVGIDCVGSIDALYRYILHLVRGNVYLTDRIKKYKKNLKAGHSEEAKSDMRDICRGVSETAYADDEEGYILVKLLDELKAHGDRLMNPEQRWEIRENYIYTHIMEEVEKGGKMFGQMGRNHVISNCIGRCAAAERVADTVGDKCARLIYVYNNCKYFVVRNNKKVYFNLDLDTEEFVGGSSLNKNNGNYQIIQKDNLYYVLIDGKTGYKSNSINEHSVIHGI